MPRLVSFFLHAFFAFIFVLVDFVASIFLYLFIFIFLYWLCVTICRSFSLFLCYSPLFFCFFCLPTLSFAFVSLLSSVSVPLGLHLDCKLLLAIYRFLADLINFISTSRYTYVPMSFNIKSNSFSLFAGEFRNLFGEKVNEE